MSLPNRMHIAWQNDIAAFTLASDVAAETEYPLTNMQNKIANMPTVIDMTGETTVEITFSSATQRTANSFALHRHTFPEGTTARLVLYPDESQGGTAVYDSTATEVEHSIPFDSIILGIDPLEGSFESINNLTTHFSLWFDSVVYKSGKIVITNDNGFTNDLLQVDKCYLAFAYELEYGPEYGLTSTGIDGSEHRRKPGGGMDTVQREVRRSLQLNLKYVQNAERHVIRNILGRAKMGGDLLVTLDPNDAMSWNYETTSIYRRMNDVGFLAAFYNANDMGLSLEEN